MPNHVTNLIHLAGEKAEVQRFMKDVGLLKEEPNFDFNVLTPMPKELEDATSGPNSLLLMSLLLAEENSFLLVEDNLNAYDNLGKIIDNHLLGCRTWSASFSKSLELKRFSFIKEQSLRQILSLLKGEREPTCDSEQNLVNLYKGKDKQRVYLDNLKTYGYPTWYEWSLDNWGTKWNAYNLGSVKFFLDGSRVINKNEFDTLDDNARVQIDFSFDTAWSVPEPIFEKIIQLYDVYIHGKAIDECGNFACDFNSISFDDLKEVVFDYCDPDCDEEKINEISEEIFGFTMFTNENE